MDVRYSSDDSSDDWESACGRQEFNDLLEGRECGTIWRMRLNLRYVLVAVIVRSVKMTQSLCSYMCVCVCASVACKLSPWKRRGTGSTDVFLSLSPTWNTGNSLFDHYLPVSLPSTGTTCYDYWCATLTGQKHTCKLKHIEKKKKKEAPRWVWLVSAFKPITEEV